MDQARKMKLAKDFSTIRDAYQNVSLTEDEHDRLIKVKDMILAEVGEAKEARTTGEVLQHIFKEYGV